MIQSRENGQKPQFGQFFDDFEVKYLQIANFSEKQVSFKLKVIFSTNFRPKTKKIVRAVFEKNIKVSDFGLIWRPFREYLQIKNFFQKSGSVTFLSLQPLTSCKKSEKSSEPFLRKLHYQPTNQPIITKNTNLIGPCWRRSNHQKILICANSFNSRNKILSQSLNQMRLSISTVII